MVTREKSLRAENKTNSTHIVASICAHISVFVVEGIQIRTENPSQHFGVIESDLSCLTYSSYTACFL